MIISEFSLFNVLINLQMSQLPTVRSMSGSLFAGRLPTTLWILEQAAQAASPKLGGTGAAIHGWCRIVLPALVLADVPTSSTGKKSKVSHSLKMPI